jgi:hypothetical protein
MGITLYKFVYQRYDGKIEGRSWHLVNLSSPKEISRAMDDIKGTCQECLEEHEYDVIALMLLHIPSGQSFGFESLTWKKGEQK